MATKKRGLSPIVQHMMSREMQHVDAAKNCKLQDTWSASGAIVVSTSFAMAEFLQPEVWQAISVLLKGAK
ncbi:MAG: hypothetical protein V4605_03895 [Pseudomonadota bacterium]